MKKLLVLFCCFVSLTVFCQDSISITINGKAIEFQKQEPIKSTRLELSIYIKYATFHKTILTDEKGEFTLKFRLPKEKNNISLDFNAEKSGFSNHFIYTFSCNKNDTTLEFNMQLNREKICKDTWLPQTIYFSKNNCENAPDSFSDLKSFISFYKENKLMLKDKKLHILIYNTYDEKSKIAKCRAEKIKTILLENGMTENEFTIQTNGKKDFTHYYYTNGCHTEKEFEEKIELTKSSYKKASPEQKNEIDVLRQSVRFSW